mmetsp:Transcript_50897/g.153118  ORF Transcript_50897/g.153118 Transcript_50897/m.153118 type:complete len:84 (+) Transcript_50897:31-282(+)
MGNRSRGLRTPDLTDMGVLRCIDIGSMSLFRLVDMGTTGSRGVSNTMFPGRELSYNGSSVVCVKKCPKDARWMTRRTKRAIHI